MTGLELFGWVLVFALPLLPVIYIIVKIVAMAWYRGKADARDYDKQRRQNGGKAINRYLSNQEETN